MIILAGNDIDIDMMMIMMIMINLMMRGDV